MAVGGAIVATAPLITSTAALADSGTVKCRFTSSSPIGVIVSIGGASPSPALAFPDNLSVWFSFSLPGDADCPCSSDSPTYLWSWEAKIVGYESAILKQRGNTLIRSGAVVPAPAQWVSQGSTQVALGSFINAGAVPNVDQIGITRLEVGVQTQCPGIGSTAYTCRYNQIAISGNSATHIFKNVSDIEVARAFGGAENYVSNDINSQTKSPKLPSCPTP